MTPVRPWDAFTAAEAEVRAMVADTRWQALSLPDRAHVLAARILVTPDGDRWLFGSHARWHLHDPADGRWHLAPPPRGVRARQVGHPAAVLPDDVIPSGPDFHAEPGSTQAFIGPDVPADLTERLRVLLRASGLKSELDYPLTAFDEIFAADVPSTVAAVWGTIMWCAYAPAFDGNERLITVFGEYLRRSLPGDEWVRWLPAPPLLDLVTLVAERQRAGRPRAALRLAAVMADTAQILLSDTRFRPRALALLTMVEPMLRRPGPEDGLTDVEALRAVWLERCPRRLCRALLAETDPAAHFSHAVYDLVEALAFAPDPPMAAATFLADLSDSKGTLPARLDHRLRRAYEELDRAGLTGTSAGESTEPEGFPAGGRVLTRPAPAAEVAPPDRASAAAVLGAAYATGLAWGALTGARLPQSGLAGQSELVRRLIQERDDNHTHHT
ncbi:hypothetical protein GBF35_50000 [Nonomuraea phyllanthi]|uniref:hypothetical protein n=1 Tax=Nonomuraea phyllanthi TaxID=2219224 RepID=UPI001293CC62|nr:hypothetical protein [Nonomuraea phyllanthi]QFY13630.1 hypothetical protein GBF35_50000 [Nonomuraea phyllanthi]